MQIVTVARGVTRGAYFDEIETNCVPVRITFMSDDIVRLRAGFDQDFRELSYSLIHTCWADGADELLAGERTRTEPVWPDCSDAGEWITLRGRKLTVRVHKDPFYVEICDAQGTVIHRGIAGISVREDNNRRRIHTCELNDGDAYYGFGEHGGPINKFHCYVRESGGDTMGYDPVRADPLYKHVPFYIRLNCENGQATGYFYHTTGECAFDLGQRHSNYWHKHSSCIQDGGDLDLFFIAGPSLKEVVSRYTDLTGHPALLPIDALGYLGSSMYYSELPQNCDAKIESFIRQCQSDGIPVDSFQLSSGYCEIETTAGEKRCVFNWDRQRFPNPEGFFANMTKLGITVTPNVKPGVLTVNPKYQYMADNGVFITQKDSSDPAIGMWWGGEGSFADFTNPKVRTVWKGLLADNVLKCGTHSVWNDNCEYESLVDQDARICLEGQGDTIGNWRSMMANIMCKITAEAIAEVHPGKRPYIVCRAGGAGIQRYAQTWAGDNFTAWATLRHNIGTILNMGMSGISNEGADIGGFAGPAPEPELLLRWVQNGIFQPRFSIHSTNTDNTVTEPWMYSSCAGAIRSAIRFRYQLMPHLYSLMRRAYDTGLPIMSAMVLEYPHDPRVREEGVNFMEGDLLIANVVDKGATERTVYFPEGADFYDFHNFRHYRGGSTVTFRVDENSIPLFIRSGGLVPVTPEVPVNLKAYAPQILRFKGAADASGSYVLYEDDGFTEDYRKGIWRKTTFTATRSAEEYKLSVRAEGPYASPVQKFEFELAHPQKAPFFIRLGDTELEQILRPQDFAAAAEGWHYNHDHKSVEIKFARPANDFTLVVSFAKFDLIGM